VRWSCLSPRSSCASRRPVPSGSAAGIVWTGSWCAAARILLAQRAATRAPRDITPLRRML